MTEPVYTPDAQLELFEASEHYEEQQEGLGFAFLSAVDATVQRLARHPEIGHAVLGTLRRLLVRRFPYGVFYRVLEDDSVEVVAVFHQRRSLTHLRSRVPESE